MNPIDRAFQRMHPRHPGLGMPVSLHRLEADQLEVGGFVIFFPSGKHRTVHWRDAQPCREPLELAKKCTAELIDWLSKHDWHEELRTINIPSVTAAVQHIVREWNTALRAGAIARIHSELGTPDRPVLPGPLPDEPPTVH